MQLKITKDDVHAGAKQGEWIYSRPLPSAAVREFMVEEGLRRIVFPGNLAFGGDFTCSGKATIVVEGVLQVDGNLTAGGVSIVADRLAVRGDLTGGGQVKARDDVVVGGSLSAHKVEVGGSIAIGGALSVAGTCTVGGPSLTAYSGQFGWGLYAAGDVQMEHLAVGTSFKANGKVSLRSFRPGIGVVHAPGLARPAAAVPAEPSAAFMPA